MFEDLDKEQKTAIFWLLTSALPRARIGKNIFLFSCDYTSPLYFVPLALQTVEDVLLMVAPETALPHFIWHVITSLWNVYRGISRNSLSSECSSE